MAAADAGPRPLLPSPRAIAGWLVVVAAVTAALLAARADVGEAHAALLYLLVVLAGSARGGRALGLALAVLCFLCFNFFLLPPYRTFVVADPLDWLVLGAFLATGAVAAQLLHRAQGEAAAARARAAEVDRLAALGAETLSAGRAEDAVAAVARVVRETLDVGACEILAHDGDGGDGGATRSLARAARATDAPAPSAQLRELVPLVAVRGVAAVAREGGALHFDDRPGRPLHEVLGLHADARAFLLPLRVRGRTVGVLELADVRAIRLRPEARRFAEALAYYAALGVERARLAAEAERVAALREADRLKDALLASVSHDLRTPLTTIGALAHEMRVDGDERAAIVEEEAGRLERLVSNLLDLSRLDGGAVRVSPAVEVVEDLVGAALQQTAGVLGERAVAVSLPPGEPVAGRFDLVHALRALANLLVNAHRYSPPDAPIALDVRRDGDRVVIAVGDRGPGVPVAERERIFEPFQRGGARPDVGGAGLGLAIARRLAEAQGGAVTYAPRAGGGSVFALALPAAALPVDLPDDPPTAVR